jgi:hypothetical protein
MGRRPPTTTGDATAGCVAISTGLDNPSAAWQSPRSWFDSRPTDVAFTLMTVSISRPAARRMQSVSTTVAHATAVARAATRHAPRASVTGEYWRKLVAWLAGSGFRGIGSAFETAKSDVEAESSGWVGVAGTSAAATAMTCAAGAGAGAEDIHGILTSAHRGATGSSTPAPSAARQSRCRVAARRGGRSASQKARAASSRPQRNDQPTRNSSHGMTQVSVMCVMAPASSWLNLWVL